MEHLDQFLSHYGYFAIFGLLMLGIVGPWIPDETILVLSGIAVHRGELRLYPAVGFAIAGSLFGITLSYMLGRTGLVYVLEQFAFIRRWAVRYRPQVEKWFARYGKWTLFFGYFIAGLRHFTALTAGLSGVKYRVFAVYAYPGGVVWVLCFLAIGYYLGAEWDHFAATFQGGGIIVLVVAVAVAVFAWVLRRKSPIG